MSASPRELLLPEDAVVDRVRLPLTYQLGLALNAVAMIVLPLIYLALVGGVAYLVFWHATENVDILSGSGSGRGRLLVYISPIVLGGIAVVFMLKPLLAARPERPFVRALSPTEEPVVYELVARLARTVGAPVPKRIVLDCNVNASASFSDGWRSVLSPRPELTLTIGLPLIRGLSLRHLTGVLSHELGHFAQGAGMRLSFVIRSINVWFARVVYERDAWDEGLERWSNDAPHFYVQIILFASRLGVWATRRVLWLLMMIGDGLSTFLLRRMEYDADTYEVMVAGSAPFAETFTRMKELSVGEVVTMQMLEASWRDRRELPDDLPRLIVEREAQIDRAKMAEVLEDGVDNRSLFDTHPPDEARIAAAERIGAPGIYTVEAPAASVFENLERVSREVTRAYLVRLIGEDIPSTRFIPVDAFVEAMSAQDAEYEALVRLLQGVIAPSHPTFPALEAASPGGREALAAARQGLVDEAEEARAVARTLSKTRERLVSIAQVRALRGAGFSRVDGDSFGLADVTPAGLDRLEDDALESESSAAEHLARFSAALSHRLTTARATLAEAGDDERVARFDVLAATLAKLAELDPNRRKLTELLPAIGTVFENGSLDDDDVASQIRWQCDVLFGELRIIEAVLRDASTPYPVEGRPTDLARLVIPVMPLDGSQIGEVVRAADNASSQLGPLYVRCMSELATLGEAADALFALDPLPTPADAETSPELDP
ncbi:MAG: M48 family metallopeptidase [Deltaproteobacteria bacterium]